MSKFLAIIALFLMILALMAMVDSPASGYESSLYASTPSIVWVSLLVSSLVGIVMVLRDVIDNDHSRRNWALGLWILGISSVMFYSIPIIRGYFLFNASGDSGVHLGAALDLHSSGYLEAGNYYPITAVQNVVISSLCGFEVLEVFRVLPVLFLILYLVFLFFMSKQFLRNRAHIILATVAGLVLVCNYGLIHAPNQLANYAFPFVLYVASREVEINKSSWKIVLLVVVIFIPLFHPLPGFVLLMFLAAAGATIAISGRSRKVTLPGVLGASRPLPITGILLAVWLVMWMSSFFIWDSAIKNLYSLVNEGGTNYLSNVLTEMRYAESHGYSVVGYFLRVYGDFALYLLISVITVAFALRSLTEGTDRIRLLSAAIPMLVILPILGVLYLAHLPFGPIRLLTYAAILSFPVVGLGLGVFLEKGRTSRGNVRKAIPFAVGVLLMSVHMTAYASFFPSPYSLSINLQYTEANAVGMDWFVEYKNRSVYSSGWYYAPWVEIEFLVDQEERATRDDLLREVTFEIPNHLGYGDVDLLGLGYNSSVYLVLTEQDRRIYADVYPEMAPYRLQEDDFIALESDYTVCKLCSNGDLELYFINTMIR